MHRRALSFANRNFNFVVHYYCNRISHAFKHYSCFCGFWLFRIKLTPHKHTINVMEFSSCQMESFEIIHLRWNGNEIELDIQMHVWFVNLINSLHFIVISTRWVPPNAGLMHSCVQMWNERKTLQKRGNNVLNYEKGMENHVISTKFICWRGIMPVADLKRRQWSWKKFTVFFLHCELCHNSEFIWLRVSQ